MNAKCELLGRALRWSAVVAMSLYIAAGSFAGGKPWPTPMELQYDPHSILETIAQEMNVSLRPDIPVPQIHLESATPLRRFQDAVEAQWGFRPKAFSNAYVAARNEIYLTDDPGYYVRLKRTLDDSLAHELAHYVQARYLNADLQDPSYETDAIAIQGRFGDAHTQW